MESSEFARISTFAKWPRDAEADVYALARQGLVYTGSGDRVVCSACLVQLDCWKWDESPAEKHRRVSPLCKFVNNGTASQVALGPNSYKGTLVTDSVSIPNLPSSETNCSAQHMAVPLSIKFKDMETGIQATEPPKFPQYVMLTDRIESFRGGKISPGQTAEKMAEAGWFYVGPGDKVRCFQCGGNLKDWEPDDDPVAEHRRWYKDCAHLKTLKSPSLPRHQHATSADAVTFRIEPKEVKARMDTPSVRTILNMGYDSNLVRQVIENQLMTTGDDFPNAKSLLSAIFALDDPQPTTVPPSPAGLSSTHSASSNINSSTATECHSKPLAESSSTIATKDYVDENQRLRDSRTCKVCKEVEVNTVFLPCGHLVCCDRCSPRLVACIVCRTPIRGNVKTFLS